MKEGRETMRPKKTAAPYDEVGAIMKYEQGELGALECVELFQRLIDSGLCWKLQGHYGRTAAALIREGVCTNSETSRAVKR